ncbi:hypothetical protein HZS61_002301 [Fusarium oxysporum f. sp. conglutinans]|uniref:DDE-1 domain-containing protein n=1 Tax=Fusarium oxysporum f. sp. conglutinans TaxID=100902 RepID=A0A8H6LGA5_FUSOX|nr:hypothetical protein HZS61_002301 [Fusarium oxysporum f. sp. conglutinans]
MSDRGNIQEWFRKWNIFTENEENDVDFENVWNGDETGFQIGYLKNGIFLWTFGEVEEPVLTDAHETISVTIVESISAKGQVIPPFIILPGVQIPSWWVDNGLEGEATIATTPKGYIDDVTAQDYFDHFERHTRPQNGRGKRVLLLDGCENHLTKELHHKAQVAGVVLYPFPPHLTHMLQPLNVGMFSSHKHWHQEVLQREITDGATDFNKADFLFHLQEIRRKATKRSTIISSWKKTGIYPFNPSAVLDRMVDPLSSLSLEAAEAHLPGYISAGDSSAHPSDEDSESDEEDVGQFSRDLHHSNRVNEENRLVSSTPPLVNWNEVITPELKMRQIRQYEQYVALRIEVSVASGTPLTPTVAHVNEKLRKAHTPWQTSMKSYGKHTHRGTRQ